MLDRIEFNLIKLSNPQAEITLYITQLNMVREGQEELTLAVCFSPFNIFVNRQSEESTETLLFHSFKWDSMTAAAADELCMCYMSLYVIDIASLGM